MLEKTGLYDVPGESWVKIVTFWNYGTIGLAGMLMKSVN